jgi:hypothetical protein
MRKLLLLIPAIALLASGCASASAESSAGRPALDVPPPPARIIDVVPIEQPPDTVTDVPQPAAPPQSSGASRSSRPTSTKPPATDSKPEAKSGDPRPGEPEPPKETPKPPDPAPQLRTPQTSDTSGAAKAVKTTIDTARGILNTVNFAQLSNERKKAYNETKLFLQQAEEAMKQGNLVYAQGVATKAETLARELAGR